MSVLRIVGGNRLSGRIDLQGAKNSALPVLAAAFLADSPCVIHNCPDISDVDVSVRILESLGCKCRREDNAVTVDPSAADGYTICDSLMSEMRSSVTFLGAILAKHGKAELSAPGGCELGLRPINLHIDSLRRMGAEIIEEHGRLICSCPEGLNGCTVNLPVASVGTTENVMIAASTAKGTTIIRNAAKEPEICDLADFLRSCGANIRGDGGTVIRIDGIGKLHGCEHTVIPDRIAAATYMSAVAAAGGDVAVRGVYEYHLHSVLPCFEQMGCRLKTSGNEIRISSDRRLKRLGTVRTGEYPNFPTDAQPVLLAASCVADGTSVFVENIFSNRFRFVSGLTRMGADVSIVDRVAVVNGVTRLTSAKAEATDLRGGAALIIGALAAKGESVIGETDHIDRGYENIEGVLNSIGADVIRER